MYKMLSLVANLGNVGFSAAVDGNATVAKLEQLERCAMMMQV